MIFVHAQMFINNHRLLRNSHPGHKLKSDLPGMDHSGSPSHLVLLTARVGFSPYLQDIVG